jgi:hypothetical protein
MQRVCEKNSRSMGVTRPVKDCWAALHFCTHFPGNDNASSSCTHAQVLLLGHSARKVLARLQVTVLLAVNFVDWPPGVKSLVQGVRASHVPPSVCTLSSLIHFEFINRGESQVGSIHRSIGDMNAWTIFFFCVCAHSDVMAFAARRNLGKAYKCPSPSR